jgi:colanic acid/amylovoran biosynthesis protein
VVLGFNTEIGKQGFRSRLSLNYQLLTCCPMSSHSPTILLMGASLGTGNRGVSALGASLIKLILNARPDARISMLIGNRSDAPFSLSVDGAQRSIPVANFRMSPRAGLKKHVLVWALFAALYRLLPLASVRRWLRNWHPLIGATANAQLVGDIRGGDSFSDIYGLRNFVLGAVPVFAVIWVRGDIVLLPQTYGPYKSPIARLIAKYILKHASKIVSRDRISISAVRDLLPSAHVEVSPDVAFALEPIVPFSPAIEPPLPVSRSSRREEAHSSSGKTLPTSHCSCLIGLNVNGLVFNGGYTRSNMFGLKLDYRKYLLDVVTALLANEDHHLLLVPHTFAPLESVESDPGASRSIMAALPQNLRSRVHLVTEPYDQNEIKGVIGLCDFFIGSRMHACIAALSQGIPTVAVAYSRKFRGVFESVGVGDCVIDAAEADTEPAVRRTLELFDRRRMTSAPLRANVAAAKEQLERLFAELLPSGSPLRLGRGEDQSEVSMSCSCS